MSPPFPMHCRCVQNILSLCVFISTSLSVCVSFSLSLHLSVFLSTSLCISLCTSLFLSLHLSLSFSLSCHSSSHPNHHNIDADQRPENWISGGGGGEGGSHRLSINFTRHFITPLQSPHYWCRQRFSVMMVTCAALGLPWNISIPVISHNTAWF